MSSLKLKTRASKHDRESIQLRKDLEQLSRKSKGEFETLKQSEKTEILLREGLPALQSKKASEKNRNIMHRRGGQAKSCSLQNVEDEGLDTRTSYTEGLRQAFESQVKMQNPPPTPFTSSMVQAVASAKGEVKTKSTTELKTKTRLYEKGVVSIRPDNPDLNVVMQGRKIKTDQTDTACLKTDQEKVIFATWITYCT